MKSYIVIGLGRLGTAVAEELSRIGSEVLVIDRDEEKVNGIADIVTHSMIGDATDEAVLRSIGVRNFDCVVVAIGEDLEHSVLVTLMLKDLGAKQIVCKARNEIHKRVLEQVGADRVVIPERDMGRRIAQTLRNSNVIDYIELSPNYGIVEMKAPRSWVGKSLIETNVRVNFGVTILAVHSPEGDDFTVSPPASYVIRDTDILEVVGSNESLEKVRNIQ